MKPLMIIRQMLIWISICEPIESTRKWKKTMFFAFFVVLIPSQGFSVVASAFYLKRFISIDLEASLETIYPIAGSTCLIYTLMVAYFIRHEIDDIFDKLSNIYDASKQFAQTY